MTLATSFFDHKQPVIELDGKRIALRAVDPIANGQRRRPLRRPLPERPTRPVDFDPGKALRLPEPTVTTDHEEVDDESIF